MYKAFDIIKIPEMDVASIQIQNLTPEKDSLVEIKDFIIKNKSLYLFFPCYHFGFVISDQDINRGVFGYERWLSIPNDLEIPEPFQKKHFTGGTYAATTIRDGEYDKWPLFLDEVSKSNYEIDITSSVYEGRMLEQYALHSASMAHQDDANYIKLLIKIKEND